jgi:DNA-binding MarR family transcriptional regulator
MFIGAPRGAFDHAAAQMSISSTSPRFTDKQGQYLAFIYTYALINRRPPAEADIQAFFGVTPPSVHNMVLQLERCGFIRRVPRQPRSITVLIDPDELPRLRPVQSIEITGARY